MNFFIFLRGIVLSILSLFQRRKKHTSPITVENLDFLNNTVYQHHLNATNRIISKEFVEVFRNNHIVLIGDSLMRYQYIDLVFSLKNKITLEPQHNVIDEHFIDCYDFFIASNTALTPFEKCDCYHELRGKIKHDYLLSQWPLR